MSLLDFARGTALQWSLIIFVTGVVWRIIGAVLMLRTKDLSKARTSNSEQFKGGIKTIVSRSFPPENIEKRIRVQFIAGVSWHLGYFAVVLLFVPHILFLKSILGFGWPGLPNPLIFAFAAITLAIMIFLLVRRMTNPVLKIISSADDYISWVVTALPLITGILAMAHLGLRYETMLAIHIFSVELLLIWFPFGKLMHLFFVFPSRYNVGAIFKRRGVRV